MHRAESIAARFVGSSLQIVHRNVIHGRQALAQLLLGAL
jgi:hypothetical protein